nr:TaqI-like C-terminal specificity domain-containing protein [Bifidobacterium catulorum]
MTWGNLCMRAQYAMVKDDAIISAPSPFIATDDWFILGVLNSSAADWYVHQLGVTRSGGYMEYKPMFVEQIPLPKDVNDSIRERIRRLAESAQNKRMQGLSSEDSEHEIDDLVANCYDLSPEEIRRL